LPEAWSTSRADDVVVAVIGDDAAADAAQAAATASEIVRAQPGDDLARAVDATVQQASPAVVTVSPELGDELLDDRVLQALERAVEAGAVVVLPDVDRPLPEDLPAIVVTQGRGGDVDDPEVTTPADDHATSIGLVAGTVALLVGQGTPEQLVDVVTGTAQGADRTVDAAAALELAGSLGAGGTVPPPDDGEGTLSPALVGAIAVGAAVTAVGTAIALGARRPRRP